MVRLVWMVAVAMAGCAGAENATTPAAPIASDATASPELATPSPASATPAAPEASGPPPPIESVLPNELGGVELHTFAVGQDILERLVSELAIGIDQLEVRYASEHGARFLQMYALRAPETTGPRLVDAWVAAAYPPDVEDATSSEQSMAGKTVTVVHSPTTVARLGSFYVYRSGDTLIVVQAFDPNVAAEALAALP